MSSQLSVAAKKQYMDENGDKCPFCRGKQVIVFEYILNVSDISIFPRTIARQRKCSIEECGKHWNEIYKLSDIEVQAGSEKDPT